MSLEVRRSIVSGKVLRCLLAGWTALLLASGPAAALAQTPPPGAAPCVTNDVPTSYGTFLFSLGTSYQQTSAAAPVELSSASSHAWFELAQPGALVLSNVVVSSPTGRRLELDADPESESGARLRARIDFGSERELSEALPPGAWSTRLDIALPDSAPFVGFFRFQVAPDAPPVPSVNNLDALNALDNSTNAVLAWAPWPDMTTRDRIHLELRDPAGATAFSASTGCGGESVLEPGATSATVPAGRLRARTTYTGTLTHAVPVFSRDDKGTLLVQRGVRTRTTQFTVRTTAGGTAPPADLSEPRLSATGTSLIFTLRGTPRTTYYVQSSTDLVSWTRERVTQLSVSGIANISVPLPADRFPRFWRAIPLEAIEITPTISLARPAQNLNFMQVIVEGTPGASYRVETSTNLVQWTPIGPFALTIPLSSTRVNFGMPLNRTTRFTAFRAVTTTR